MSLEGLLSGESQYVEYKRERPDNARSYLKTVVAFANARGGTLVFGVDDKTHEVVGIPRETLYSDMDAIANAISDAIQPAVYPDITAQYADGKNLILVSVPYGKSVPYAIAAEGVPDGVYVRVGATTRHADDGWVRELVVENSPEGYDRLPRRGYVVDNDAIDSLCERMYEVALERRPVGVPASDVRRVGREQLMRWGVLCERNGEVLPTVAFSLLSGDGRISSSIQCAVFRGTTRSTIIDRREFEGSVIDQFEDAYQYALSKLNMGAAFGAGSARADVYELPHLVVREAIANAVIHRSYLSDEKIQILLFDDRLEVTSPGGIVRGLTLARILEGASKARNHALVFAFAYMNVVESFGTGVLRMEQEMKRVGLGAPEFIDYGSALRVNLYRPSTEAFGAWLEAGCPDGGLATGGVPLADQERRTSLAAGGQPMTAKGNSDNKSDNSGLLDNKSDNKSDNKRVGIGLEEGQALLLEIMRDRPTITQAELVAELGVVRSTVSRWIKTLQDNGYLLREGSRKNGRWVVLVDPDDGDVC